METIKSLLNALYSSDNGMLYFYIISAMLALFFIVLIIITIKKSNNKNMVVSEIKQEENKFVEKSENIEIIPEDNTEVLDVVDYQELKEKQDEDIELPKLNSGNNDILSNELLVERLNALKNK